MPVKFGLQSSPHFDTSCIATGEESTAGKLRVSDGLKVKEKIKAVPVQAWTGPEGSRRSSLTDFTSIGVRRW